MRVLNLLTSGGVGGIEVLCRDIGEFSNVENRFAFLYGGGNVFEQMKSDGKDVHDINCTPKISLKRVCRLLRIAKDCNVIIVHHDDHFLQIHFLILLFLLIRKKYISMVHHCYHSNAEDNKRVFWKGRLRNHILQIMFRCSDRIIFVSNAGYASYTQRFRIDTNRARIVYNGISRRMIQAGKSYYRQPYKGGTIHLYYVGRLVKIKGVDLLIYAFSCLSDKYDIDLTIIGDGSEQKELKRLVKDSNLENKVVFDGFLQDVIPCLKKADLFIYPSRTEIFGISLVEAMAFGNICIANAVGGIPEIIKNGVNGFLNDTNDVKGLTEAIKKGIALLADEEKAKELICNAKMTAETFCVDNTIQNLNNIYAELF